MTPHSTVGLAIVLAVATFGAAPATMALATVDRLRAATRSPRTRDLPRTWWIARGAGLVIGADGITLDLNGHRVDGDGSGDDVGIDVKAARV